jgi:DNA-binding NarL/FixJ family response regulator
VPVTTEPIRVVIADDQRVIRDGLATILATMDGVQVIGAAADGAEAVALAEQAEVDVVLMDLRMPGTDGVQATTALRATRPETAVVVLTTYLDDESILAAMRAGAAGYLTKNASIDDIRRALQAAVSGQTTLDSRVSARLVHAAGSDPAGEPPPGAGLPDRLTDREGQVLALAAQGLSNAEIAERLYVSRSTIKTHINQIFAKTGSRDRPQAIAYAHRHGITATGSDESR